MKTVDKAWEEALRILLHRREPVASRNGLSQEILGYHMVLHSLERTFLTNSRRRLSLEYASAELIWLLSGQQDVSMICKYAPSYSRYADDGKAHGHYGWRWANEPTWIAARGGMRFDQFKAALNEIDDHENTRRAVVTMWNAGDLAHALRADRKDLPCTLSYQFIYREKQLHMICTMRSEDVWVGMPYDIWINTCLLRLAASHLNVQPGDYVHQVGSLHLYTQHKAKAMEALTAKISNTAHNWKHVATEISEQRTQAVENERSAREDLVYSPNRLLHPLLSDAVKACANKWMPTLKLEMESELLKEISC